MCADGACFYRAIAALLSDRTEVDDKRHLELRKSAYDYIAMHREFFEHFDDEEIELVKRHDNFAG